MNYLLSGSEPTREAVLKGIKEAYPDISDADANKKADAYFASQVTPGVNAGASNMSTIVTPLPDPERAALASVFEPKNLIPLLAAGAGAYFLFS